MEREEGFYWVKFIGSPWEVARWIPEEECLLITGDAFQHDGHQCAIGPRIEPPNTTE